MDIKKSSRALAREPLTWGPLSRLLQSSTANIVCSNGHGIQLEGYIIGANGSVHPSVRCEECEFDERVTLIGWDSG
jgi:hypothetical protein